MSFTNEGSTIGGRKREERVKRLESTAHRKRGLTCWRGGRGRNTLVSLETRHIANEDSLLKGRKREGRVGELHKRGLTD
jgi:hypothetical protein